jgi:hypothetical protein
MAVAEFDANKKDVESNYLKVLDLEPEFAERVRAAKREMPFAGAAVPNYFRKPYGPGLALVGDQTFSGKRPFDAAMEEYQRARDEHVSPMYEFTCQLATLAPRQQETQQLFAAITEISRRWTPSSR